ncbi:MAG: N-acetyltransferase [Actinomycetaceae bacterium]|nr:N-acetyltransferase [Actinomycetaceae bacterium]
MNLPMSTGLKWSPLHQESLSALTRLIDRMERQDNPPYRTSTTEVDEMFSSPHPSSALGGWDADGQLRAYGFVRLQPGLVTQAICAGGVDPMWRNRGVGKAILRWEVAAAREILIASPAPTQIVMYVDGTSSGFAQRLVEEGFTPRRTFTELRRPVEPDVEIVEPGRYLSVVPWSQDLDDQVMRAHNKLLAEISGTPEVHTGEWLTSGTFFAPEWSFVVLDKSTDRTRVAGYLMSGRYEQDWAALGWKEGYTEILGVLPDWRDTSTALALVTSAMKAYAEGGMEYAAVGLAADNTTGVADIYSQLGYSFVGTSTMWVIDNTTGATPQQ